MTVSYKTSLTDRGTYTNYIDARRDAERSKVEVKIYKRESIDSSWIEIETVTPKREMAVR